MFRLSFALLCITTLTGCPQASEPMPAEPVSPPQIKNRFPIQSNMELGVVVQGTTTEFMNWVRNESESPLTVAEIKASCECLEVQLSQKQIAPKSKFLVYLGYDGAKEANFLGSLLIEVELLDDKGQKVGQIDVPIEVVKAETVGKAHQ